jgi:hypothetical protein
MALRVDGGSKAISNQCISNQSEAVRETLITVLLITDYFAAATSCRSFLNCRPKRLNKSNLNGHCLLDISGEILLEFHQRPITLQQLGD